MRSTRLRRVSSVLTALASLGLLAAACTPGGFITAPAVPTGNFAFKAVSTVVNSRNDLGICFLGVGDCGDEPSVINIGFTVQIGVPGSATAQVVVGDNPFPGLLSQGPDAGGTYNYGGAEQGTVPFSNIPLLDTIDLFYTTNHLTVAGVWAWKIENDFIGVGSIATLAADAIKAGLNETLAVGSLPSDSSQIASTVVSALTANIGGALVGALNFLEANIPVLNILSDDSMGSAMYIGLGVRGDLAAVIDYATAQAALPNPLLVIDNFPLIGNVKTPPDIGPSKVFSLGNPGALVDGSTNPGVSGHHTTTYSFASV